MSKEILLYGNINSETSVAFINAMHESKDGDVEIRIACNGGEPEYGWGMIAKFAEHPGKKIIKVDGKAYSMGAFFLCYADQSEALDVAEFLIHRAAYSSWIESNPDYFTDALKENLLRINTSLQKALEAKIDVPAFEAMKGVKIKDIFSMNSRIDVFLSAKEAKKIGLISKIVNITPQKKAEIESKMHAITAEFNGFKSANIQVLKTQKTSNMETLADLKAAHPNLFAEAVAVGVAEEKDRVGAWLAFVDVDAEAVSAGIKEGKALSMTAMADLSRKSFSKDALKKITAESAADIITEEVEGEKPVANAALSAFEKEARAHVGLKN